MLSIPERVSKRARLDFDGFDSEFASSGLVSPGASGHIDSASIGHFASRFQPSPLLLNLDPAGALASTQTRVPRGPPLILSPTKNNESATTAEPPLDAATNSLCLRTEAPCFGLLEDETPKYAFKVDYTWDDFMTRNRNLSVKVDDVGAITAPGGASGIPYSIDFSSLTKEHVLRAAMNAAIGFESALVVWDEARMQLRVAVAAQKSKFGHYLSHFATCGSYVRRLRHAAQAIRDLVNGRDDSRTALALASSIESEVETFVLLPPLDPSRGLVSLYSHCSRVNALAASLAELIGCADMSGAGKLLRVPAATALLDRAYNRALLQESRMWHGAMLWRLVSTVMGPWLEQLSFVIGITEPLVLRKASKAMQSEYFPELFIDVHEEEGRVSLNKKLIPSFMSLEVADAAVRSYNTLIIVGLNGYHSLAMITTNLPPLTVRGNTHGKKSALALSSLGARQPGSIHQGVHAVLGALASLPDGSFHDIKDAGDEPPPSVKSEIWRTLIPVVVRFHELNTAAKQALRSELDRARNTVSGVYLLGDGVFWSVFQDLVGAMYKNLQDAVSFIPAMDSLVKDTYPGTSFVAGTDLRGGLQVAWSLPASIEVALSKRCIQSFQVTFARLLDLHCEKRETAFALLATDAMIVTREIDEALDDPARGLQEVIEAFEKITELVPLQ